jgi:hypothetical protein
VHSAAEALEVELKSIAFGGSHEVFAATAEVDAEKRDFFLLLVSQH